MKNIFSLIKTEFTANFFTIILSVLGMAISGYLWYGYAQPHNLVCTISECQVIRQSEYSVFLGVSIPVWGFFFYTSILVYNLALFVRKKRFIRFEWEQYILFGVLTIGFVFSLYLTYLEAFVIEAWCQWCVASFIISTFLFALWLFSLLKKPTSKVF